MEDKTDLKMKEKTMWENLAKSPNVLSDYYYVYGNRWIEGNRDKLVALTGINERQINNILQSYRSQDALKGVRYGSPGYSYEQKRHLKEAYKINPHLGSERITELAQKTGLLRTQIATWFSRERRIRDGTFVRKRKPSGSSKTVEITVERESKRQMLYFSIENILSDQFPSMKHD